MSPVSKLAFKISLRFRLTMRHVSKEEADENKIKQSIEENRICRIQHDHAKRLDREKKNEIYIIPFNILKFLEFQSV